MEQKLLTPLELKVMNILWSLKKAFVKELIAQWPDKPEPAYNTVSTIVRILAEKGYVGHEQMGRSHQYFPIITKTKYQKRLMKSVMENVFSGSLSGMISSLLDNESVDGNELSEIKKLIDQSEEKQ
ncbi:MAG: BlaI/MecI/CopY family transcriptional regulator [Bacteroidota bacterium]